MNMDKVLVSVLLVGVLVGCLTLSTVHAQDMSIWVGKWFKLTYKTSGYSTNDSGIVSSYNRTEVIYSNIWSVDEANKVVNSYVYSYHDDQWRRQSSDLHYLGGSSLNFLCYHFESEYEGEYGHGMGFTARIQGKMKNGVLTSATFRSLGGCEWEWDTEEDMATGVTITGSLIPESKLPPDIPIQPTVEFHLLGFPFVTPADIERLAAFGTPNWSGSEPHNGIDLIIYPSLSGSKIISPVKGTVRFITVSQNPYSNPVNQLLLQIEIFVNFEWTVNLVFEPGTANEGTKAAQISALKVQVGQVVDIGQEIGDLIVGELGHPHLHYMLMRNGQFVCAYTYSSGAAKQIFDEIATRSNSVICY